MERLSVIYIFPSRYAKEKKCNQPLIVSRTKWWKKCICGGLL